MNYCPVRQESIIVCSFLLTYRKDCLKLLKNLLSELKESDSSFDKFCSYHVKTTLLHACCSRTKDTDWSASSLSHCFQQLLQDFVAHLESGELNNFFIPTQNLLSGPGPKKCNMLACRIREECDRGFPIFQQKLHMVTRSLQPHNMYYEISVHTRVHVEVCAKFHKNPSMRSYNIVLTRFEVKVNLTLNLQM